MKCPWCAAKLDPEVAAFVVHAVSLHASEIKDVAAKLMTSEVVWVVPTPADADAPKETA